MGKVILGDLPEPPYEVKEAIERLRVNLGFLGKEIRRVMVTSAMPDEGKSYVSMQLWRQMAETGIHTVLVDMDMRKSVLAEKYQIISWNGGKIAGTSGYLSGKASLVEALCATDFEKGYLVPNIDNMPNSVNFAGRLSAAGDCTEPGEQS